MQSSFLEAICGHISESLGVLFQGRHEGDVGGGCISRALHLSDGNTHFFVKINQAHTLDMFESEAAGLHAMRATETIATPKPICHGVCEGQAYLVLQWKWLKNDGDWAEMGRRLAAMHNAGGSDGFGFRRDNYIGATPQMNSFAAQWADFFVNQRLAFQFEQAKSKGGRFPECDRLLQWVADLLETHQPIPALVHGDLWSGNASFCEEGPFIFDPACYYGDREVDLAMTRLFGGFPRTFYEGYHDISPPCPGAATRSQVYNLYHILNHFNLFGGHYQQQANQIIDELLRRG